MTRCDRLKNKAAIVTGAGKRGDLTGTGEAISVLMARAGASVLLVDMDVLRARRTLTAIESEGGRATLFEGDVTREQDCQAMVAACVAKFGGLDILVNNVATGGTGVVTDIDVDDWDRTMDINLKSMMLSCKCAVPHMAANGGGAIINIASIDGMRAGWARNVPYSVSKAGAISLTQVLAVHHGRDKIRVNCIAPGHIYAPFVSAISDTKREQRRRAGPLGSEGNAWDVAWAAVFLASEEARWISGVVLPIDAGLLAATPLAVFDNILEGNDKHV